mgnify:CR=1 FL=1
MKEIKWAVLGCGVIANEMAVALQKNGKNIYAVGNRTHEKAAAFAEKYGIGKFTMISMRCLPIRRSMSFISRRRTTRILAL